MNAVVPLCVVAAFLAGLSIRQTGPREVVDRVRALQMLLAAALLAVAGLVYWWPR